MAILNGKTVDDKEINPNKHKFIGSFRYPFSVFSAGIKGILYCSCGSMLHHLGQVKEHYDLGHFDIPQYEDIRPKKKIYCHPMQAAYIAMDIQRFGLDEDDFEIVPVV